MTFEIRRMTREDIPEVGRIGVEAFNDLMARHNRPPLYPDPQVGPLAATAYLSIDPERSLVATEEGRIVGSVFFRRRDGVGRTGDGRARGAGQGRRHEALPVGDRAGAERRLDAHHAGFAEPRLL